MWNYVNAQLNDETITGITVNLIEKIFNFDIENIWKQQKVQIYKHVVNVFIWI